MCLKIMSTYFCPCLCLRAFATLVLLWVGRARMDGEYPLSTVIARLHPK